MKIYLYLLAIFQLLSGGVVSNYHATPVGCIGDHAIIRSFDLDGEGKWLTVNINTLQTHISGIKLCIPKPCPSSKYTKLLDSSASAPFPLSNDGITHHPSGNTLTTDLCPSSKKGFEKRLYETIIDKMDNPVPVTLFITGKWINKHPVEFAQFRSWEAKGKLGITWGNHTYTHPYSSKLPDEQNFSLTPGYDLRADTLKLEKYLIELGITPSVFFRFPGLISDKRTIKIIHDLGLITIGADAWLAIGQKPKKGSIILLHGNKNEPRGVDMFFDLLKKGKIGALHSIRE